MSVSRQLLMTGTWMLLAAISLRAQMGDSRDKAGQTQKPPPAEWIRPAPILSPEEALRTFTLPPGFRIEVVAAEPLVQEPVALDFDPDGRLWVVEMRSYMPDVDGKGEDQRINRIVVLEDTNHDGRMDKSTVYMDGLGMVRAVKVLRNGVLVGDPPNLWFTRDTDGDGKADEKTAIATDFSARERNPEEGANALIWGLDNWIGASSYGRRFRWKDGHWVDVPVVVRGQWGQSMDDYGRLFTNANEDYLRADLISAHYPARNPHVVASRTRGSATGVNYQVDADQTVWPNRPTPGVNRGYWENRLRPDGSLRKSDASCGPCIYRGDNFPAEFYGNYFSTEPAGHVVRRTILTDEEGILRGRHAYDGKEFLNSTDERFRPVNVYTAPDGTLYVVDLHRGILQHRQYMTSYLRNQILDRGLARGLGYGRIYRIVHEGKKPGPAPALSTAGADELVDALAHPNGWWRDTAQRLLVESGDTTVAPKLRALALSPEASDVVRLKALWTLEGLGGLTPEMLAAVMEERSPKLRAAAIRLSEPFLEANDTKTLERVTRHAADPSREVRLQLALSVAKAPDSVSLRTLADLLTNDPKAPFLISAAVSSLPGREVSLLDRLLKEAGWREERAGFGDVFQALASAIALDATAASLDRLLEIAQTKNLPKWQRVAVLDGIRGAGLRNMDAEPAQLNGAAKSGNSDVARAAAELKSRLIWPGKFGSEPPPLTAAEQQLFEKGKKAYETICAACHQPDGRGREGVAAPLVDSPWVLGPDTFLARIVLKGKTGRTNVTMPPLEMLGNDTLAAALTYVRRSWGNLAPPVSPGTVGQMREAIILRSQPYTEAELEKMRGGQ